MLRGLGFGAAAGALAACGATPQVVEKVVKETVVQEVQVTSVVVETVVSEVQVEVTKLVEVPPTAAARTGPTTVTYYMWTDADLLGKFGDWVAPFQEANPDIFIQLVPAIGGNIEHRQKLQAMILAGNPPAIAGYAPPDFYWQGMVVSLPPFIERDNYDMSDMPQPLIDRASYQGELYNFPLQAGGNNAIMAYNKTMFAEAGVEPPPKTWNDPVWTWTEWVSRMQAIMKAKNTGDTTEYFGVSHLGWFMSHTRQWNIWWINVEDMKTITCDTPEMVDCYTHVNNLWCVDKVVPQAEITEGWGPIDPFLGGKTSMRVMGSWEFLTFDRSEIDWDFAPFPKPEKGNTNSELDPDTGAAIVKGAKNPDQAWEFIKWMDNGNYHPYWGSVPSRPKYIEDWGKVTFTQHPDVNYLLMQEAQAYTREQDRITLHPCWGEMYNKVIHPRQQQLELCELSVEQMLAECQTELQTISDSCQTKYF